MIDRQPHTVLHSCHCFPSQTCFVAPQVPNGDLTVKQLRYLGDCIAPFGDKGCGDITTRANAQLRGVTLAEADNICQGLVEHGLSRCAGCHSAAMTELAPSSVAVVSFCHFKICRRVFTCPTSMPRIDCCTQCNFGEFNCHWPLAVQKSPSRLAVKADHACELAEYAFWSRSWLNASKSS